MKKFKTIMALMSFATMYCQQQTYNITFESGTIGSSESYWRTFESDTPPLEIVANPYSDAMNPDMTTNINTSSTVAKFTALQRNVNYAGTETLHAVLGSWQLESGNNSISLWIYKPLISEVRIKFVTSTNATIFEIPQNNTKINTWELMTWDISSYVGATDIDQLIIYPDFNGSRTQDNICYFDNVTWSANKLSEPTLPQDGFSLPINFESDTPFSGQDGGVFNRVSNTPESGNMSAFVGQIENINSQNYSHAQIITETFDFSGQPKGFSMKVKGNRAIPIKLKLENSFDSGIFSEQDQNYNTPGSWQNLIFDFTGETSGNLDKVVIFFDIESAPVPGEDIFLFDDIIFDDLASLSINDVQIKDEFKIFPNPSEGLWNIQAQSQVIKSVVVYDILGNMVYVSKPNNLAAIIESRNLSNGVYFAKIITLVGQKTVKLIKN